MSFQLTKHPFSVKMKYKIFIGFKIHLFNVNGVTSDLWTENRTIISATVLLLWCEIRKIPESNNLLLTLLLETCNSITNCVIICWKFWWKKLSLGQGLNFYGVIGKELIIKFTFKKMLQLFQLPFVLDCVLYSTNSICLRFLN